MGTSKKKEFSLPEFPDGFKKAENGGVLIETYEQAVVVLRHKFKCKGCNSCAAQGGRLGYICSVSFGNAVTFLEDFDKRKAKAVSRATACKDCQRYQPEFKFCEFWHNFTVEDGSCYGFVPKEIIHQTVSEPVDNSTKYTGNIQDEIETPF